MSDLSEIQRSLGRVEGKLDAIADDMKARNARDLERDKQIDDVKRRQYWFAGVAAAIGAVLGIGGSHGLKL